MSIELNLLEKLVDRVPQGTAVKQKKEICRIIEALLVSSSEPISLEKFKEVIQTSFPIRSQILKECIQELQTEYRDQQRGFQIDEIAEGFVLRTVEETYPYVELFHQNRRGEKLSRAATEVLAIVAYKQPVTRPQLEAIRGVDSSAPLASLVERGLVQAVGRLDAPGKPVQYGVTTKFLRHFGLKNFDEFHQMLK